MKKTGLLAVLFLVATSISYGQKIRTVEGDDGFDFIVGQAVVNVEFDYSDMGVGKFDNEEDYVNKKVAEYNEKEAGRGDNWKESWYGSRERVYHTKFLELFNKYLEKKGIAGQEGAEDAAVKLVVHTVFTEPGFNIGITRRDASCNFEYIFYDNSGSVLAKFTQSGVPGSTAMGMDFDTSQRISECYAKAGKMLSGFIYGKIKKK